MNTSNVPYFMWDYNLTEAQIQEILRGNNETQRLWITGKILEHAKFEDVWKYLDISKIVTLFPKLRLRPSIRNSWKRALTLWGYHV